MSTLGVLSTFGVMYSPLKFNWLFRYQKYMLDELSAAAPGYTVLSEIIPDPIETARFDATFQALSIGQLFRVTPERIGRVRASACHCLRLAVAPIFPCYFAALLVAFVQQRHDPYGP